MNMLLYLVGLALGVIILIISADWFTGAAVDIARILRVPEIVIGATIVSFATTVPEFMVSFVAAVQHEPDVAVGNAVGSVICNIGLILGACALITPLVIVEGGFLTSSAMLLVFALIFGALGWAFPSGNRWVGVTLIGCLLLYLAVTAFGAADWSTNLTASTEVSAPRSIRRPIVIFVLGAVGVIIGSELLVKSAVGLAQALGVSKLVISLTIVALGTSLPELVVSVTGIVKRRRALSLGNILGANILNLAWVMGCSSLVADLPFRRETLTFDVPVMITLCGMLMVFGVTGDRINRREGAALFLVYLVYTLISFTVFGKA
jgi:cation:H+ antiporter